MLQRKQSAGLDDKRRKKNVVLIIPASGAWLVISVFNRVEKRDWMSGN